MFNEYFFRGKLSLTKETGELVPVGVGGIGVCSRGEGVPRKGVSRERGHWDVITRHWLLKLQRAENSSTNCNLQLRCTWIITMGSIYTHCITHTTHLWNRVTNSNADTGDALASGGFGQGLALLSQHIYLLLLYWLGSVDRLCPSLHVLCNLWRVCVGMLHTLLHVTPGVCYVQYGRLSFLRLKCLLLSASHTITAISRAWSVRKFALIL